MKFYRICNLSNPVCPFPVCIFQVYLFLFSETPKTQQQNSSLAVLNGVRVMSMGWVILGHLLLHSISFLIFDNDLYVVYSRSSNFLFQVAGNCSLSVDSFFILRHDQKRKDDVKLSHLKKGSFNIRLPYMAFSEMFGTTFFSKYFLSIFHLRNHYLTFKMPQTCT